MGIKLNQGKGLKNQPGFFIQDRSLFDDYYVFTKTMRKQDQMSKEEKSQLKQILEKYLEQIDKPDLFIILSCDSNKAKERIL